ncbi:FdtA/QdtA family cupin domain-containing protein [Chitinophagaceae bacterium LB-8]|uniref:FdtA/QdtA family cupin domain-containing protein n=1 Tax=Paraflavisolibacter caeni TaxID=2982496 RepID=A0A9X2XT56_9BACT|nr:FdtA/QdtA family cupin domain-containing protein [Paraflavisolibacter caeni]MCU7548501.1 FdtA/QdtA family cupin domain-containing protein [Paraflavisolibacter caeni]
MSSLNKVKLISLPKILDERGNLSFFESRNHLPFEINRVYWIYDVPGGEIRGGHAFKQQEEIIVALSGSFDIVLNDGMDEKKFTLNRSYSGLYIPAMIWRHMENFSTNSLAFVAASTMYDDSDYMRLFDEYKNTINDRS